MHKIFDNYCFNISGKADSLCNNRPNQEIPSFDYLMRI